MNEKKRELLAWRLVVGQFCDDVRFEVGHKLSLIGCYGDEMIVQSFPATLPKLAVQAKAITTMQDPFERLTFKLNLQSDTVAQMEASAESLTLFAGAQRQQEHARWIWVAAVMVISPLVVTGECELCLFAETKTGPVRGSVLKIRGASSKQVAQAKSPARRAKRKRPTN